MVFGIVSGLAVAAMLFYYDGFDGMHAAMPNSAVAALSIGYSAFHLLIAPALVASGWYLLRYRQWARATLTVVSGLMIVDFPIGSALGAYNLWVLLTPESEPLFARPAAKKKKPAAPTSPADEERRPIQPHPARYPGESS